MKKEYEVPDVKVIAMEFMERIMDGANTSGQYEEPIIDD